MFSSVFENAFPGKTLLQVLGLGGGGLNALGRHTVSALLNAASADVFYDYTASDVINKFNALYPTKQCNGYENLKNDFASFNEQECPIGVALGDGSGNCSTDNGTHGKHPPHSWEKNMYSENSHDRKSTR